uniref:Uncharacterized protein n=1 Tax=Molossus molossus TaxID=27622 RepID=A0A7J8E295_MOLMO|nr:hypothetical protein HJG59_008999 [Molossus molossus]
MRTRRRGTLRKALGKKPALKVALWYPTKTLLYHGKSCKCEHVFPLQFPRLPRISEVPATASRAALRPAQPPHQLGPRRHHQAVFPQCSSVYEPLPGAAERLYLRNTLQNSWNKKKKGACN